MTSDRDQGSITAFVVVITLTVMMCAGLVIDGARSVANHVHASDHAENAARAGAQQLVALREGAPRVDVVRARAAAYAYLGEHGLDGEVHVTPARVTVTVTLDSSTVMLALVGVDAVHARATRSVEPVSE